MPHNAKFALQSAAADSIIKSYIILSAVKPRKDRKMFADRIENLKLYIPYNEKIKVVCDYLAKTDIHALEVGKYDVGEGVRVVVNAFTPKTREAARWETHKKYIDLQYLIEGDESMGYLPVEEVEAAEYDAEKDVSHPVPKAGASVSEIALTTGCFAFLEPRDAHRPSVKLHTDASKKLIFKIPV